MDNIKYSSFKNICRICLFPSDLIVIHDNYIINILQFLSGARYSKTDGLPQKLCMKCFQTMNEIQSFSMKCKKNYLRLLKCQVDFKDTGFKFETVEVKEEITNECDNTSEVVKDEFLFHQMTNEMKNINIQSKDESSEPKLLINEIPKPMPRQHRLDHPYLCNICNKTLRTYKILVQHKKTHSNEYRYECDVCTKGFQHSVHLMVHKRMHSGERPYKCEVCDKAFSTKSQLVTHKAIHGDERRFNCDICLKGFNHLNNLIVHKRMHSGERPFQCDVCNKTFTNKSNFLRHQRIHSDVRRYECELCMKTFKHSSHLTAHKRLHTGERPFHCDICNKAFADKSNLVKHKSLHVVQCQRPFDDC